METAANTETKYKGSNKCAKDKVKTGIKTTADWTETISKNCICGHRSVGCSVYRRYNLLQQTFLYRGNSLWYFFAE